MKISARKKFLFLSLVIISAIGFISYAIYKSNEKIDNATQWVHHTELAIHQSGNILSLTKDLESASRGYAISNDSAFLKPLFVAEKDVFTNITQLRLLLHDNPSQQSRIDSLSVYIRKRLNFSLQIIEIRNKQGMVPALAYISTRQGKGFTDRIREISNSIQLEERSLLKQREKSNEEDIAAFYWFRFGMSALLIVFTILLLITSINYFNQHREKRKGETELTLANKELAFQNDEKEKRAAELIIANEELAFQNNEKEKRAAELTIANKELAFQNDEKEKRAAELIVANAELAFQNNEKEKRAAELTVANTELAFQNDEKEKRAAELIIANEELAFQNKEKEKRAAELIIANNELAFQNEEKAKRALELIAAYNELKIAEDDIRKLNEDLEEKVIERTEQLQSANKELESFSYSVSHDLRAPLRAVHGYAKMLKRSCEAQVSTEENRLMDNIMNNAKKMGQLIDELLTFSRLGRKELIMASIPMHNMVKNICDELKIEKENQHIIFHVNNILAAQGDIITVKQVWLNLISNAVKYSRLKEKPVIEISSSIKENEIIYKIQDNGAGFDMRYADKLFGVFQRLHSDDEFEGIGVGLAIVDRIITKHGGRVWAEAKVGEGAIFYFTLNK